MENQIIKFSDLFKWISIGIFWENVDAVTCKSASCQKHSQDESEREQTTKQI